jgi:modulator of FtsH protease HflC
MSIIESIVDYLSFYRRQFAAILGVLLLLNLVTYTVDETKRAVVLQMGKPVREVTQAGLYFKAPWPIQSVRLLEKRLVKHDGDPREVITKDKKAMVIDAFSYFRITDGIRFLQRSATMAGAQARMDDSIYSELTNELGGRDFEAILTTDRLGIVNDVTAHARATLPQYGIGTDIVLMNRTELPKENKEAAYNRMIGERQSQAARFRSEGNEEYDKVKAATDRETRIINATATEAGRRLEGEGDAEAARIYNEAYSLDPEFFRIYRGLIAAKKGMEGSDVRFILNGNEPHLKAILGR